MFFFSMFNTACSQFNQTAVELDRFLHYWPEQEKVLPQNFLSFSAVCEMKYR